MRCGPNKVSLGMVLCLPAVSPDERPEIQKDFELCHSICGKLVEGNEPQNLGRVLPIKKRKECM